MKTTNFDSQTINFSHLDQAWDLFPFSCSNGYYFLWNSQLSAPKEKRKKQRDAREYISNSYKGQ